MLLFNINISIMSWYEENFLTYLTKIQAFNSLATNICHLHSILLNIGPDKKPNTPCVELNQEDG